MSGARARDLRKRMTPAEARLWNHLRELRPLGFHIRRQVPLHGYVLDFACFAARLVIEVDGETHATEQGAAKDTVRDARLSSDAFLVLRFSNADVLRNIDGVMQTITAELEARRPSLP